MTRSGRFSKKGFQLILGILIGLFLLSYIKNPIKAQQVGGPCEGCEAVHEYGSQKLTATDTLPAFNSHQSKMLVTGIVYKSDGKTPASDVIVYAY